MRLITKEGARERVCSAEVALWVVGVSCCGRYCAEDVRLTTMLVAVIRLENKAINDCWYFMRKKYTTMNCKMSGVT